MKYVFTEVDRKTVFAESGKRDGRYAWLKASGGNICLMGEDYDLEAGESWVVKETIPDTTKPAPKERTVFHFEAVDKPEKDGLGHYWYLDEAGQPIVFSQPLEHGNPLRRTVERIPVEPETWDGTACVEKTAFDTWFACVYLKPGFIHLSMLALPTREAAAADLPFVKDLAEQYADRHNAVIYWEGDK